MWQRAEIKSNAKAVLHRSYWIPFLVCLILTLLGGGFLNNNGNNSHINVTLNNFDAQISLPFGIPLLTFALSLGLFAIVLGIVFHLFVLNPLYVGQARYFIRNIHEEAKIGILFSMFQDKNYWNIVKIMAIRDIKTTLWFLCLIFPGIYKTFQYSMIPYLLAEDSSLTVHEVFSITKELTSGHIWDLFVLNLSFIGWYLLGSIIIIGKIFVDPYYEATLCEAYEYLKQEGA